MAQQIGQFNSFLKKIKPLRNKLYENKYDYFGDLDRVLGSEWSRILNENLGTNLLSSKRIYSDKIEAFYADGFRGNFLVIVPQKNLVAIRCADYEGFNYETDFFSDFVDLIVKL